MDAERCPHRTGLPASSCLSLRSDSSKNIIYDFSKDAASSPVSVEVLDCPASSCESMRGDSSKNIIYEFTKDATERSINFDKSDIPASSCQSFKSEASINILHDFRKDVANRSKCDCPEPVSEDGVTIFKLVEELAKNILLHELRRFERILFPKFSQSSESEEQNHKCPNAEDPEGGISASEGALKITLHALKRIGQKELANRLEKSIYGELDVCQRKLRRKLKKFEYIYEGVAQHGNQTLLNKVYTELYITEGVCGGLNNEHEVRQIEAATRRRPTEERPIKCEDIFMPLFGQDGFVRTVLTKGIAGIGKTISVQKFNLEWAEGRVNQDIQLLLNLPFRELNLMKEKRLTLTQLLHHFLAEAKESGISNFNKYKLALIFDGLDECRLPLDFDHNEPCSSFSEPASVDVLLTNLIKGNLLPSAHIWITSRPAAANRIPADLVNRVTEIRGFNNPQKEEYFRKKISDPDMASKVISHVKSIRSLHIMCHIPVFSWISATVLQRILKEVENPKVEEDGSRREMPETLTQMYTHFLEYNSVIRSEKYSSGQEAPETESQDKMEEKMILKLGKLAFEHLMNGNMIFYEHELNEYHIDMDDAAVYSGVFTQISKNDFGVHVERVYCFVHLSIQEYFAAMYVFHTFVCSDQNLMDPEETITVHGPPRELTILLQSAVDRALLSDNGHLDLFLRFLLGLSQTTNQALLKRILTNMASSSPINDVIKEYIKEKIHQNPSPERCVNLFHCLSELNDQSLLEEIQHYLNSGSLSETLLSPSQWSALVFMLLTSKDELDEFDLREYSRSEEGLLWLLPVIKESRVALLKECNLTDKCCKALGEALSDSCLKELDLSDNDLKDSGVGLLCVGLASPTCQLEKLRLPFCGITETGCKLLAKALRSNPNHLKELDLSYNHPGQPGMELWSAVQEDINQLTISMTNSAECYLKSSLRKYACHLTMDVNTAHSHLSFSEDKQRMTHMEAAQLYPDSPERFTDWGQVLCEEGLSSRCYWEVEWTGERTGIGVAYKGISRKAKSNDSVLGYNNQSWSLRYCNGKYTAWHNRDNAPMSIPYFDSKRVGVFLDWSAGSLSFYAVSLNTMTHLHTFHVKFSEPLFPGFRLGLADTSLSLCQL